MLNFVEIHLGNLLEKTEENNVTDSDLSPLDYKAGTSALHRSLYLQNGVLLGVGGDEPLIHKSL